MVMAYLGCGISTTAGTAFSMNMTHPISDLSPADYPSTNFLIWTLREYFVLYLWQCVYIKQFERFVFARFLLASPAEKCLACRSKFLFLGFQFHS